MGLLDGKVCLITGASRGIGAAAVKRFTEEGAVVYANARTPGAIDERCRELTDSGPGSAEPLYFDVCDENAAKKAIMDIKKKSGRLDVLLNNAGIMKDALIGMIPVQLMRDIFETNVFGSMIMLQLAARVMKAKKTGSIINLSSIVGLEGNSGQLVYSASKGAVAAMTRTASKELAADGIRVNAIAPGMIDTDMFRSIGEAKVSEHIANIRFGRLGTPEEVADAALFLASDMSKYVTGEIIGVNGSVII